MRAKEVALKIISRTGSTLHIARRLNYLRSAELGCAVALPAALIFYWLDSGNPVSWATRLPSIAMVAFLLLQGSAYWHLKRNTVVNRTPFPRSFATVFTTLRKANLVLFACIAVWIATRYVADTSRVDSYWAIGLLAFAGLEHINYYTRQLMYDTLDAIKALLRTKSLRPAALATDLKRASEIGLLDVAKTL
jgi:hypothetical protein